ncbi:MAG: ribosome-associated translation inhibitor RaiA [Lentisphaeria bacterium]|nr:ribosome-associated translation inhibitor RaiA [Lentisphaeria bacterium]NQZ71120.1 ribosome-associated translation inhibitor RaiA [Lentisphaeria bacterium]
MEKIISARHFNLFEENKDHVYQRLSEFEGRTDLLTSVRAVIDYNKHSNTFHAEIVLHGNHINIEADSEGDELIAVFEKVYHKVDKQLRKHIDKMQDHKNMSISDLEMEFAENRELSEIEIEEEVLDSY